VSFGGDKILINGTNALAIAIGILGFIGITVIGSVAGRAVQQDFEVGIHPFFFSAPITKRAYFFGRLVGAWLTLVHDLPRHRRRRADRLALARRRRRARRRVAFLAELRTARISSC
jgi:hypothetical protein